MGGAATGSAECRRHWTAALIPESSGQDTHPSSAEQQLKRERGAEADTNQLVVAMREQGRSKTGITAQTGTHECSRAHG